MTGQPDAANSTELHYTSQDGLRLYARAYLADGARCRPVVCLPGLARNAQDFHVLASYLSSRPAQARDVYCLDYRGRGRSQHDRNWRNYTPYIEMLDVLDFMTLKGLHGAAIIGTSRGGILAMLMAAVRPAALGVAVLNDIGPELQTAGLARIIGYVGRTPLPASWAEATRILRRINGAFFTRLSDEDWEALARQSYLETDGRPAPAYDPRLARTLSLIDAAHRLPDMWPQFTALSRVPTLAIRGENSDMLSPECLAEMAARHPALRRHEVEGEGHAPLLRDADTLAAIEAFLASTDTD